jgi:hypothetical protein
MEVDTVAQSKDNLAERTEVLRLLIVVERVLGGVAKSSTLQTED